MSTTHTFFVAGTHCAACKILIEDELSTQDGTTLVTVSLADETLTVETERTDIPQVLVQEFDARLRTHGYSVHIERPMRRNTIREWLGAVSAVVAVLGIFVMLEKTGIATSISVGEISFMTALFIGLVASVSTCLAVVGGLVLSVSATYAREGRGRMPQVLFHAGRLGGFLVLGGLLGALGEVVHISVYGSAVLGGLVSIIMLGLGLHLLEVTRRVRTLTIPSTVSKYFIALTKKTGSATPILLGVVTFFLPCGFTQSMQIVALSSGSMLTGALTMFAFALGTLPVLALVSFGSLDLARSKYRGTFFKAAGMLVILFAVFTIQNTLAVFGIIKPLITL